MGFASLILGAVSTLWAALAGSLMTAAVGAVGVLLGLIAIKWRVKCAEAGLLLSVNGLAWSLLYLAFNGGSDPIADWLGLL